MIKSCLKRIFSIISLLFCTMSIASAWDVNIAEGRIKFETERGINIRQGKNNVIEVRLKSINEDIINEILQDYQNKLEQYPLLRIYDYYKYANIVFYKYFRVQNVQYQLIVDDNGECEKALRELGINVKLKDNKDDFSKMENKSKEYVDYKINEYDNN